MSLCFWVPPPQRNVTLLWQTKTCTGQALNNIAYVLIYQSANYLTIDFKFKKNVKNGQKCFKMSKRCYIKLLRNRNTGLNFNKFANKRCSSVSPLGNIFPRRVDAIFPVRHHSVPCVMYSVEQGIVKVTYRTLCCSMQCCESGAAIFSGSVSECCWMTKWCPDIIRQTFFTLLHSS